MNENNVVELKAPAGDALGELLKGGARQLLAQAIEAEVAEPCPAHRADCGWETDGSA